MSVVIPQTARPTNLHFAQDVQVSLIDADVYNICERVREISERLFVVLANRDDEYAFVIMERCDDGVDRMVFKAKELDDRVLSKLRKLMAHPLSERLKVLELEEKRLDEQAREEESEDLYERLGGPMWTELEKCGFIDGRGVSYPKKGVARARALRGLVG